MVKVIVSIALLYFISFNSSAQNSPATPSTTSQPTFWQRVGAKTKEAAGAIGKGVSNGVQEVAHSGSTRGNAYRPISPANGTLENIFPASQLEQAGKGQIPWPRIALTVEEYGVHLDCWTFKAKVWTSATSNHDETFEICGSAPVRTRNDLGEEQLTTDGLTDFIPIESAMAMYAPTNTGSVGTEGPNPPQALFERDIPQALHQAEIPILWRLLTVTGFLRNISGANHDYRMWIAGYNPAGNHH